MPSQPSPPAATRAALPIPSATAGHVPDLDSASRAKKETLLNMITQLLKEKQDQFQNLQQILVLESQRTLKRGRERRWRHPGNLSENRRQFPQ